MEILLKNNIRICFCFVFSSMESIINHNQDEASIMMRKLGFIFREICVF